MEDFARDVIVQLEFEDGRECVVVVVTWGIADVGLGRGIAEFFARCVGGSTP